MKEATCQAGHSWKANRGCWSWTTSKQSLLMTFVVRTGFLHFG